MRVFMIVSALVVLVHGRPEPPSGYQYPSPGRASHRFQSNSYSAPLAAVSSLSDSQSGFRASTSISSQGGSVSASASSSLSGGFSGAGRSSSGHGAHGGHGHGGHSSRHNGHDQSGNILVHKHIYVHVPPPDHDEEHHERAHVHVPAPEKHYKIIFIKAPSAPAATAPVIPAVPQNEEKTLVYVLVKKPEEQQDIVIPTAAPTEPSKPEVYFIRYKSQKEDSHSHDQGVAGHDESFQDDTVEVGARQGGGSSQNGALQNSAFSSSFSSGSSVSTSSVSGRINGNGNGHGNGNGNGISSQYGVPRSSGPY